MREELNQIPEQATCYKYIGDIYFHDGEFLTASENYNLSLEKVDKDNDRDLYANLLIKKSMLFVNENRFKEASAMANEGLKIASEIGANMTIRDALQALVTISLKTKDYKLASDFQQRVRLYNDTLFSNQLSEKIFLLEYQLEKQQKNAKIDLLNKDNSIKELRIKRIRIISLGLTDSEILAFIIRNLISNGIKYTQRGGVVTCTAYKEEWKTVFKVSDTGIGMKPETLEKLFKIEETFSTEGTGNELGTGLGLIICKEFTETLGDPPCSPCLRG